MKSKSDFYDDLSNFLGGAEITDNTVFFDELGISGYDALNFIEFLVEKYNVDFTGFIHREYYAADGENFLSLILSHFFQKRKTTKSFTGLHLYEVVKVGRWFEQD